MEVMFVFTEVHLEISLTLPPSALLFSLHVLTFFLGAFFFCFISFILFNSHFSLSVFLPTAGQPSTLSLRRAALQAATKNKSNTGFNNEPNTHREKDYSDILARI